MSPEAYIAALTAACQAAVVGFKGLGKFKESRVSPRERELLVSAHERGMFHIVSSSRGMWIMTTKQFMDDDPATAAHYLEAFRKLCHRGLIVPEAGVMFRLSGTGFDLARQLASHGLPGSADNRE